MIRNLQESQQRARKIWSSMPLPTSRENENFRWTSLKGFGFEQEPVLTPSQKSPPQGLSLLAPEESSVSVISSAEQRFSAEGVDYEIPSVFAGDYLAQLAAAKCTSAVLIKTRPEENAGNQSTRTTYWMDPASSVFYYRKWIVVENHSSLKCIDEFLSEPECAVSSVAVGLIQIHVKAGANLHYSWIQNWSRQVSHFARIEIVVEQDAYARVLPLQVGGAKSQIRIEQRCLGRGAQIDLEGAAQGKDDQHFDFWIRAEHSVPDTKSQMNYRTVVTDRARAIFNGNIVIHKTALRTKAFQKNKNMILSPQAGIDTFPKLEIATDEVECAHGASSSPVLPEQKFYLESRGIDPQLAEKMIVRGFIDPVVSEIHSSSVRERVRLALGYEQEVDE